MNGKPLRAPSACCVAPQLDTPSGQDHDARQPSVTEGSMDVVVWLRSLGLGKYEAIFRENDIDETVLPSPRFP